MNTTHCRQLLSIVGRYGVVLSPSRYDDEDRLPRGNALKPQSNLLVIVRIIRFGDCNGQVEV